MPRASCLVPQITSAGRAYRKQFRFRVTLIPKLIPKLRLGISLEKLEKFGNGLGCVGDRFFYTLRLMRSDTVRVPTQSLRRPQRILIRIQVIWAAREIHGRPTNQLGPARIITIELFVDFVPTTWNVWVSFSSSLLGKCFFYQTPLPPETPL